MSAPQRQNLQYRGYPQGSSKFAAAVLGAGCCTLSVITVSIAFVPAFRRVLQIGNSLCVTLPLRMRVELGITRADCLSVTIEDGALVLRRVATPRGARRMSAASVAVALKPRGR